MDPENDQFVKETSLPTPMTTRVYVNLPEGNSTYLRVAVFCSWKSGSSDKSGDTSPLVIAVMSQLLGCKFHHGTLNPKKPTCSRRSHGQGAKVAWSSGVMVPEPRNCHWRNLGMGQNMSKPENKCIFVLPFTSCLKYLGYQSFDPDGMIL